jgi:hypothetical protein
LRQLNRLGARRRTIVAILASAVLGSSVAAAPVSTLAVGTTVFVSPAITTISPLGSTGGQVSVSIKYNAAVDTSGGAAGLQFDRTKLRLTAVAKDAAIVADGGSYLGFPSLANTAAFIMNANTAGQIPTIGWSFTDGNSFEAAGVDHGIVSATFSVVAAGDSAVVPTIVPGVGGLLDGRSGTYGATVVVGSVVSGTVVNGLPKVTMAALPAWRAANDVTIGWTGTAGSYPILTFDVRYRRAAWNGSFGAYSAWLSAMALTTSPFTTSPGSTYCFSGRARDDQANVSPWSAETCTAAPLDDRSLTRSTGWAAKTSTAFYRGTYVQTTTLNAKLTRSSMRAKRIALVATTCATCGSVRVYLGTTLLKSISLKSSTTVNKKLFTVATFTSVKTGTLTIKVASSGKKVIIDGLVLSQR